VILQEPEIVIHNHVLDGPLLETGMLVLKPVAQESRNVSEIVTEVVWPQLTALVQHMKNVIVTPTNVQYGVIGMTGALVRYPVVLVLNTENEFVNILTVT